MKMLVNRENIKRYADEYEKQYKDADKKIEEEMKGLLAKQRYLKRDDLIKIGNWKSNRPRRHYESEENDDETVQEITKFSFETKSGKAKIKSLLALKGVSWPVASTILHFAFPKKYPIMDFRVIRSLFGMEPNKYKYNFDFWQKYYKRINEISKKHRFCIRKVEKALWKFDKEKHPRSQRCKP